MYKKLEILIDNNIIDKLLEANQSLCFEIKQKCNIKTHGQIFQETKSTTICSKKDRLLEMYPEFKIITINDNLLPMIFPATFLSPECSKKLAEMENDVNKNDNQTQKNKHSNDHRLAALHFDYRDSPNAFLITEDKKFKKRCENHSIPRVISWDEFLKILKN